jgi:hypothetical protein
MIVASRRITRAAPPDFPNGRSQRHRQSHGDGFCTRWAPFVCHKVAPGVIKNGASERHFSR